jgi:hypothetical protein
MQNGKELLISQIYFPMENLMDRVHDAWTRRHGSGPPWTEVAWTRGHGGALVTCDMQALGLTGARWRWWRGTSQTRRCWRGAHRSSSGSATEAKNGDGLSSVKG